MLSYYEQERNEYENNKTYSPAYPALPESEANDEEEVFEYNIRDLREQAKLGNVYAEYRLSRLLFHRSHPCYDAYEGSWYLE